MKNLIKSVLVLVCICTAVTVLLALTNSITDPIIKENEQKNANAALLEVLPDGGAFEAVDVGEYTLPATVSEVYSAENGGYVIKLDTTGYSSGMVIMCGISPDGKVAGTKLIASAETPAIGGVAAEGFASAVVGADSATVDSIDTVAGATKTTAAYRSAVKDALNAVTILGGGEVDLRTEEEILRDNILAAIPNGSDAEFTSHFFVEVVDGIDAAYTASDGSYTVFVIGEVFIAVNAEGTVVTECTEAESQIVTDAMAKINSTTTEELDLTAFEGLPSQLIRAERTESGNYIIEIKGAGYGITGGNEYHPASGEYIVIRVSMTPDGRIIDCYTVSQAETDGLGSACADEEFYGQFDGKTEENYADVDAISGATLTTDGYKKAILRAFESVKIFEAK